ncbi:hypothetical protein [Chitinophaga sp. LS1]|uniref:hypothetical protein n=1 Tax=Chitinophaga sp. LS1 TaxID=3051176 RepID=UPI002AAB44E5|nr:hypothetical protein [Chitinophaga sp. LS1]WPV68138.1 hypothetical protein QQL36_05300 [Chitinophaga sp. LS1]
MKIVIYITLIVGLISCNRHTCQTIDDKTCQEFRQHLNVIKGQYRHETTYVSDYRKSLSYISRVTGYWSNADYSSTVGFRKKKDYNIAIRHWEKWYRNNRCLLTRQYVDSVMTKKNK